MKESVIAINLEERDLHSSPRRCVQCASHPAEMGRYFIPPAIFFSLPLPSCETAT